VSDNPRPIFAFRFGKVLLRVAVLFIISVFVGGLLNGLAARVRVSEQPAGFWRGVAQGALMPMACPSLLVGRDVTIYAQNNTGIHYKLGYTAGVNVCGAVFFGFFFWRVRRWRQWASQRKIE
jgi:hypothetical protein